MGTLIGALTCIGAGVIMIIIIFAIIISIFHWRSWSNRTITLYYNSGDAAWKTMAPEWNAFVKNTPHLYTEMVDAAITPAMNYYNKPLPSIEKRIFDHLYLYEGEFTAGAIAAWA